MIYRLEDERKARHLFGNWQETMIWSCLQGIMGSVYADDLVNPQSAMAVLGDFCFFAGYPSREMVMYKPGWCNQSFIIMIPQHEGWAELITECYGERAKKVSRYAIRKETGVFDKNHLQMASYSLGKEYEMKRMDRDSFDLCKANDWSRDLVSQFESYEMYEKFGVGVVVLKDGKLVSGASSYARYQDGIEIEIDTKETDRRNGLAYACGARLILECLQRDLYPSWDAQNKGSVALAEKLGYHYDHAYTAYEIWGY